MRGILHWEDWGWSNAPRGKGSNTSTTVQNNAPPPQFTAAFQDAVSKAQNVAAAPLQQYPGTPQSLVAPFSPDQQQAMGIVEGMQGIADPYINAASQYMSNATAPLKTDDFTGYLQNATGPGITNAANTGVSGFQQANTLGQGMLANASQTGQGNILGASQSFQPGQIPQWMSPYTQNVVAATQAQFNNQNQQQQAALKGNAASQGALGGDRLGVAQAQLAGQQQLTQAPTIANLYQQGYTQAEQAALQQAQLGTQGATAAGQLGAGMAQAGAQLGATTAQGAGALGLQGATSNAQMQANAAQQAMAANQAQAWLNSQAGFGMGQLGQEAQSTTLGGANALMGVGGMQQQLAQQYLNIPYEQFVQQQAYPFQTTGWLANIEEGLGSAAGGTGTATTTSPGPSAASSIAGAGLAGAGLIGSLPNDQFGNNPVFGSTGFFGSQGPLFGSAPVPDMSVDAFNAAAQGVGAIPTNRRGGAIRPQRALGGGLGNSMIVLPAGMRGIEDPSVSFVPEGTSPIHGPMNILHNFGQTSTSSGGPSGGSQAASAIGDIATIAKVVSLFVKNGGRIPPLHHLADGGVPVLNQRASQAAAPSAAGYFQSYNVDPAFAQALATYNPNLPQGFGFGMAGGGGQGQPMIPAGMPPGISGNIPAGMPPPGAGSGNLLGSSGSGSGAVPSVTLKASGHGGPDVPMLSRIGGGSSSGSSGSGGGSLNDYLNSVLGQIPTQAQLDALKPKPPPAPAAPTTTPTVAQQMAAMMGLGGGEGGMGGNSGGGQSAAGSHETGTTSIDAELAAGQAGHDAGPGGANDSGAMGAGDVNGGMGGMYRFGGRLRFADGGGVDDDKDLQALVGRLQDAKDALTDRTDPDQPKAAFSLLQRPSAITNQPVGATLGNQMRGTPGGYPVPNPPPPVTSEDVVPPEFPRTQPIPYIVKKGEDLANAVGDAWKFLSKPAADPGPMNPKQMYGGTSDLPLSTDRDVLAEGHVNNRAQQPNVIGGGPGPLAAPADLPPPSEYTAPPNRTPLPLSTDRDILSARAMALGASNAPGSGGGGGGGGRGTTPPVDKHDDTGVTIGADTPDKLGEHSTSPAPGVQVSSGKGKGFPWEALLYAGLGILGGKSPHAGVNIGQGALGGLKLYEDQQLREEQQAQRAVQQQQLEEDRRQNRVIAQQRADQTGGLQAARQRAIEFKQANPTATNPQIFAAAQADLQTRINPDTGSLYTPAEAFSKLKNLDVPWARLAETTRHDVKTEGQGDQRLADARAQHAAANALRSQALAQTQDANEKRQIQQATDAEINAAKGIIGANPALPWSKALEQARAGIASSPAQQGRTAAPAAPAAPTAIPTRPNNVPPGSAYSASRQQWRDATGKTYDANGNLVQ